MVTPGREGRANLIERIGEGGGAQDYQIRLRLTARRPDEVALFVSDLMAEVRATYPEIEACGGHWVDADALGLSHRN